MDRTFLAGCLLVLCLGVPPVATGLADDNDSAASSDASNNAMSYAVSYDEEAPLAPLSTARANQRGNELLSEGRFGEAADVFREEALKRPENGILQRNLAGALSRSGQGEESLAAYSQALRFAGSEQERAKVLFDLGNALASGQQAEQALQVWAQAMLLDPEDMDIKHNFEWLLRQMQEQDQQEQQDDSNKEGEQGPEEQEPRQDQEQEGEQESPEQQEQQQSEQEQDSDAPDPDEMQPQPSEPTAEMSEEDARRLLDAMLEEEKELQAERNQKKLTEKKTVEKDW